MKTLAQRVKELRDEADEPFERADKLAADAVAYIEGEGILGYQVAHVGTTVEIAGMGRRIHVMALPKGGWQVDDMRLDHDDVLDAVLTTLMVVLPDAQRL